MMDKKMLKIDSSTLTSTQTACLKHVQVLEDCYMAPEKFTSEFKVFIKKLNMCFTELTGNAKPIFNTANKSKVLLCLSQISKSFSLFADLLCKPLYRQGVWYVCERLRLCVSELRRLCCDPDAADDGDSESAQFLRRVDLALQRLEAEGSTAARDASWTQLINDIVCQAITIAKIATTLDYNEITSACQGILEVNSHLTNEEDLNPNQLSLMTDSLFNGLVSLEERVNVAILRLVLQVFSDPSGPVKRLVRQCGHATPSRSLSDLDSAVAELDAHIERVMLIGQFAVSCCDDTARVRGMRCCLASVESIDNYLVPALKALYLTPGCEDKRKFAQLLCDHWQDEASSLLSHLNNVIDSAAFTKVVQESVNDLCNSMCREETAENTVKTIIKHSWLLYKHLVSSGIDLSQLKQSVCECEAAINQKVAHPAVVKRVRLIVAAIDQLVELLVKTEMSQQLLSAEKSALGLQRKICEVKKNLVTKEENTPKTEVTGEGVRKYIADNSVTPNIKLARKMFETPKNMKKPESDLLTPFLSKTAERNTTLYVRTPRRMVQRQVMDESHASDCSWSSVDRGDSLALEISDILDNLSSLADTLSSDQAAASWQQPQPSPPADVMKRYFSGASFDSQWFSMASVKTDEVSADVDTPERLQDLKLVNEKIRDLKSS